MKKEQVLCIEKSNLPCMGGKRIKVVSMDEYEKAFAKENHWFIPRERAEGDSFFLQIIPYSVIRYESDILVYKRPSRVSDLRLRNRWSLGVGGHINTKDLEELAVERHLNKDRGFGSKDLIDYAAFREIKEEFGITENMLKSDSISNPYIIYDPSDDVGRVHVGIVNIFNLIKREGLNPDHEEIESYEFLPLKDFSKIEEKGVLESWSHLVVSMLREIT